MSATARKMAPNAEDIRARKGGTPLVSLTAYTTPMAQVMDGHCDFVLVGDSVGMVLHGLTSTLGVTMEMMILHGQAVARGLSQAMMVIDMPFASYEEGPAQAFRNAARLMAETGAGAVKLEGGVEMAETIRFLVKRGIPVMAHIGLTPQSINTLGGYKVQGRDAQAEAVLADAHAVAEAGAFSVVLEKVPQGLADRITAEVAIPTIGIGASAGCDGQILVVDDMLGFFTAFKPKFVKRYADLGPLAEAAISEYAAEVRARSFPAPEHVFADQAPAAAKTTASTAPQKD
ncbi:3-methyl-2-oxobutanoate hydroxymethyltransferase PanB [Phaeobacter piscinae]|uniref:3-methyl-2-oxobutanoate hydroxymethyltransferase n=1 Tax=Phaeobacter piscinae TaxID=1580596 RepID=A0ABM6P981_9RHOB|nr:3-methyl-2-oxobutanoate hydroxymethyltransferase [Phaeobacter piscinae]ATG34218.1 3-methyl-2-oxobutanoate hydroxymethyltransferase PanB [Phaeobacter piscinae]AUQ84738.1 3-methyl-2-oxobutanoate hydroxymethyltransferase PanB [Phaeobacter piscinae]AUR22622.1 3-methyl-2-oxobutanoate hydroxymethyltransferase PanB [Phaeobacter piscinae]